MVPGPNPAHPADGQGWGRENRVRGHLVTSNCNVHPPAATRLCFSCTGREEWKGGPRSFMEHAFLQDGKNKSWPNVTGKDVHPLQGPKVPLFAVICGFILSLQTKALYTPSIHLPHPFGLVMTSSLDQQSGSAGKWEIYSENCHFPRLSPPPRPSSSQRFVLLLDVKLMILTPRCVMLS